MTTNRERQGMGHRRGTWPDPWPGRLPAAQEGAPGWRGGGRVCALPVKSFCGFCSQLGAHLASGGGAFSLLPPSPHRTQSPPGTLGKRHPCGQSRRADRGPDLRQSLREEGERNPWSHSPGLGFQGIETLVFSLPGKTQPSEWHAFRDPPSPDPSHCLFQTGTPRPSIRPSIPWGIFTTIAQGLPTWLCKDTRVWVGQDPAPAELTFPRALNKTTE